MHIGFTGSRDGMTGQQSIKLYEYICGAWDSDKLAKPTFHHGDCVGADELAHDLAKKTGMCITIHPPKTTSTTHQYQAHCEGACEIREPKPHIKRNHDIVDECDWLIATPSGTEHEQPRSGTWATIRYAHQVGIPVTIIKADGTIGV